MVKISDQLCWELTKNNNCFIRKKNGKTKRSGSVEFSAEEGNLKSMNMLKYSGIANSQVIDVVCTDDDRAQLITKTASKCHTKPSKSKVYTNVNKDFKRSEGIILKTTVNNYYRRDLKDAALGKFTKVYQANRRAKEITKPVPVKRGRRRS